MVSAVARATAALFVVGLGLAVSTAAQTRSAKATVKIGNDAFSYQGGYCLVASDGSNLQVLIGQTRPVPKEGVLLSAGTIVRASSKSLKGGGHVAGNDLLILVAHANQDYSPGTQDEDKSEAVLAPDLKSGTFTGISRVGGRSISGSFTC